MKKLILTITRPALLAAVLALSACGAIPTAIDAAQEGPRDVVEGPNDDATEAPAVQSVADNPGLGTIVSDGKTSAKCKRRRITGSNIRKSGCTDPDSGSQPVRVGTYTEPVLSNTPGSVRPSN